jgi:CBS domain-containing protein
MLDKVCTKPVITASAQMTVSEAARAMRSKNIGALVVVNAGRPVGMLTDRDIAVDVVARGMDPDAVQVGDVMRKKPTPSARSSVSSMPPKRLRRAVSGGCRWWTSAAC